jgi:hypothetical protein
VFLWHPSLPPARNQFVQFRADFPANVGDRTGPLMIFADSRYRLWINGEFVLSGPARFAPGSPEYDTLPLHRWSSAGVLHLAVEVLHRGERCFQAVRRPGALWVEGGIAGAGGEARSFADPAAWRCRVSKSFRADAPSYSFAMSAVEVRDTRLDSEDWLTGGVDGSADWVPAVPRDSEPWGPPRPRSIPMPSFSVERPSLSVLVSPLRDDEVIWSAGGSVQALSGEPAGSVAWFGWVFSPRDQVLPVGHLGEALAVNGAPVTPRPREAAISGLLLKKNPWNGEAARGSRRTSDVALRPGWNLVTGLVRFLGANWAVQVSLPARSLFRSSPSSDAPAGIGISHDTATIRSWEAAWPSHASALVSRCFSTIDTASALQIPSLRSAWDVPAAPARARPFAGDLLLPTGPARSAVAMLDFERTYLGHVRLEVTAPAGTVLDVAYDERLGPTGLAPLYRHHPDLHTADRFICRGGRQVIEAFHPRSGRYLQIIAREASAPVVLHDVGVRDRHGPLPLIATFACPDETLTRIWHLCRNCVVESLEESWIDGWREQGVYLGDTLVQFAGCSLLNYDASAAYLHRTLGLFLETQNPDGQMQPCTPCEFRSWHPDYTLLWGLIVHDEWRRSGRIDAARRLWPGFERILHSPFWKPGSNGLWDSVPLAPGQFGGTPFVDWGIDVACRWGESNLILNALRVQFLRCAGELSAALGDAAGAARCIGEAEQVARTLRAVLWNESEGRFADSIASGQQVFRTAMHGNVFALMAEVPDPRQRPILLRRLVDACAGNAARALAGNEFGGHMDLYFCHFVLSLLGREGLADPAESLIRSMWAPHFEHDARGCWEALCRGPQWQIGSVCHSWSVGPLPYLAHHVLGVQWDFAAEPGVVHVRPVSASLASASGVVSLPGGGSVEVKWQRRDDGELEIASSAHGPYEVRVHARRAAALP